MLRIVDMSEATGTPGAFAVWNTVTNVFFFAGGFCWDSAEEFKQDVEIAIESTPMVRASYEDVRDRVLTLLSARESKATGFPGVTYRENPKMPEDALMMVSPTNPLSIVTARNLKS